MKKDKVIECLELAADFEASNELSITMEALGEDVVADIATHAADGEDLDRITFSLSYGENMNIPEAITIVAQCAVIIKTGLEIAKLLREQTSQSKETQQKILEQSLLDVVKEKKFSMLTSELLMSLAKAIISSWEQDV